MCVVAAFTANVVCFSQLKTNHWLQANVTPQKKNKKNNTKQQLKVAILRNAIFSSVPLTLFFCEKRRKANKQHTQKKNQNTITHTQSDKKKKNKTQKVRL